MYQEDTCEKIIEIYLEKRQNFIKKDWLSFKSFWKRAKGNNEEFTSLRRKDIEIQKDFEGWLKSYAIEQLLDVNKMKKYLRLSNDQGGCCIYIKTR